MDVELPSISHPSRKIARSCSRERWNRFQPRSSLLLVDEETGCEDSEAARRTGRAGGVGESTLDSAPKRALRTLSAGAGLTWALFVAARLESDFSAGIRTEHMTSRRFDFFGPVPTIRNHAAAPDQHLPQHDRQK